LEQQPTIPAENLWLWNAFWALSSTRKEISPICFGEIYAYCKLKGFCRRDDIEMLLYVIKALDPLWLSWASAKVKSNA